jgi:predicted nucleic acid-binding protein
VAQCGREVNGRWQISPEPASRESEIWSSRSFADHSLQGLLRLTPQVRAVDLRLTVYDTLYLALAERLNIPLVTADRKLYDRASSAARDSGLVRWIADTESAGR